MVLTSKFGCGCSSPSVQYAGTTEVARQCGNTLVLLDVHTQQQRLLVAGGQGIQSFCCCTKSGLIAVAEQGYKPRVAVYRQADLKQLQALQADAEFAYTAVALSHDGELLAVCSEAPDMQLSVWHWKKKAKLSSVPIQHAVSSISFHPADPSCLVTVSSPDCHSSTAAADDSTAAAADTAAARAVQLWRLDKLWSRHELHATQLQLPADCVASCHAWAPEGLYLGCRNGAVLCMDPETSAVIGMVPSTADASAAAAGIASIAVNKDAAVVAGRAAPQLMFYSRAVQSLQDKHQAQSPANLQLVGTVTVSNQGCESICFGGPSYRDLVAHTTDGSLLLLTRPNNSSNPTDVQVEPLADCHTGPITSLTAAPDGAHIISCGMDGSIRVWAAATGQLVGKRDLAGRLSCCAAALGSSAAAAASKPVMAVGSEGGFVRLLALSDPQQLPVYYRSRLHQSAVTHVSFNPGGTCLAAAAAVDHRIALLALRGCEHVDMLGYYKAADHIQSICWFSSSPSSQAQLLLSLAGGGLVAITPPTQPYSSSGQQQHAGAAEQTLELGQNVAAATAAEVPLMQLAAIPPGKGSASVSSSGGSDGSRQQQLGAQVLALGSDGQLHRLLLPADAAGWANLKGKVLRSIAKVQLSSPSTAIAVSPGGHLMLLAGQDGSLTTLPAASATATAAAIAAASTTNSTAARSSVGGAGACASVLAHGSTGRGSAASVVAWSAGGQWAASAGGDGSLLLHAATGLEHTVEVPRTLPLDGSSIEDQEASDDPAAPTVAEATAAASAAEAYNAGAGARQASLQRLQALQGRLAEVLQANAAAPPDQRLSDSELILNTRKLDESRAQVDTEVTALLSETMMDTQITEIRAERLKALCWDSMQTKGAMCTGLKNGATEVWNCALPAQDEARWAKAVNLRRTEIITAAMEGIVSNEQQYGNSSDQLAAPAEAAVGQIAAAGPAANAAPAPAATNRDDADADGPAAMSSSAGGTSTAGSTVDGSTATAAAAAAREARESIATSVTVAQQLLAKIGGTAAKDCKAQDLLYPELDVTYPQRKLIQAELYKRMVWELKTQFNDEFHQLVQQKHRDADRLSDLAARMDDLIRELVKIHSVLNPTAANLDSSSSTAPTAQQSAAATPRDLASGSSSSTAAGVGGEGFSGEQLAAELSVGRLTAHWSPLEELEDMLLHVKPGEVKAPRYLSPAERGKAAAEAAAAEEARRKAAGDDSGDRALKQMMGGKLERATDEVAELVASRPAWMSGDPATFNEEQLREYKEYCAKEQAAIEERLKRKAVMETELRTLKASAEDIAIKLDDAVAALAAKRLDLQMEVAALECRILRLMADYEVAAVTAGRDAELRALEKLQITQEQLVALERELSETQELQSHQQEALTSLQGEARQHDRTLRSEFSEADSASLSKLVALYKNRIAAAAGTAVGSVSLAGSTAAPGSGELEFQPLSRAAGAAVVMGSAAGGGAAAAAAAASSAGGVAGGLDLRGPLGPAPVQIIELTEALRPDGLDISVWEKFIEYRTARAEMDVALREQTAKLAWLQRQHELLAVRHSDLVHQVEAAAEELEVLRTRRAAAIFDVELQFRLKQGQVECSPGGVSAGAPDALLVGHDQIAALNSSILAKGHAKLDLLKQMKEFKRGIYQLEWVNRQSHMEAEDIISLTQQLQLLHVTKDFQQLVKGTHSGSSSSSTAAKSAGTGAAGSSGQSGANKEVQSLENLLQVRETLHQKAVAEKRRQLKRIEGLIAAKQQENAAVALQLSGLEKLLDDRSRLEGAVAAGDPGPDRTIKTLMMQRKLRDIAAAQAAEIAAAEAELHALQQRSFPSFHAGGAAGGAAFIPAISVTSSVSSQPAHAASRSTSSRSKSAAAGPNYGGGVVASPGGSFAPSGTRDLRPVAPAVKAAGNDSKSPGSPRAAAQPGRLRR